MKRDLIVFTDSGDTLVDESTEIRDGNGIVISAELHDTLLQRLHSEGYTIALVADGEVASFKNIYEQHKLSHVFAARAISEALPERKPAAVMFQTAMEQLGLSSTDKKRIVMIGNNLKRDIVGANRFGIISILYDWSPRYNMIPETEEETPDYRVSRQSDMIALLDKLDRSIRK